MRLMEVGTKSLTKGDKEDAQDLFQKSYQLYSLFWGLNLGVVKTGDIKREENNNITLLDDKKKPEQEKSPPESVSVLSKLGQMVQKAIDCCKE